MNWFRTLRVVARPLLRRPGFSALIVLTLGVGIGASAAMFSLVYGVLLKPLPYPEADRLMTVWEDMTRRGGPADEWTGSTTFLDWQRDNRVFEDLAAYDGWSPNLAGEETPEQLSGLAVTPGWFRILGVAIEHGRAFDDAEGLDGAEPVVVISHQLWQRRFGGDAGLVGSTVRIDDRPVTLVGILPPDHEPLFAGTEIWRPLTLDPATDDRGNYFLRVIGRLRSGIELAAADRDMDRVGALIAERSPAYYRDVGVTLIPLHERLVGSSRGAILALAFAVALLLVVACTNVANLLLVHAVGRRQELAVRASLGAARGRLVGQLVAESLLLAVLGGALGMVFAHWGTKILVAMAPAGTPRIHEVVLHPQVLAFGLGLSLLTGLVFGLVPAFDGTRHVLGDVLRPGGRVEGRGQNRLRSALVIAETALALSLLVGAGLLIKSFWGLLSVDLGFRPEGVVTSTVQLPQARYAEREERIALVERWTAALADRGEIASAAVVTNLPMSAAGSDLSYYVEGTSPVAEGEEPSAWYRMVTPAYFDTLGIQLLSGRPLSSHDRLDTPGVVVVSERFARRWFGDGDAVGKRMKLGDRNSGRDWMTIVAVVADLKDRSPMLPSRDDIYLPYAQWGNRSFSLVVRSRGPAAVAIPALRAELQRLDPALPMSDPVLLQDLVADTLWLPRLAGKVLAAFALVALALAALGLYGVLAHTVYQRRREMGIRTAMGAERREIVGLILAHGLRLAGLGVVLGLVLAIAFSKALEGLLYGVTPGDPSVLAFTVVALLATAALASWVPATRASRVDPAVCLREE